MTDEALNASSTRRTMGRPATGTRALQLTPAALATGSSGPRSPARTMAANFSARRLMFRWYLSSDVFLVDAIALIAFSAE